MNEYKWMDVVIVGVFVVLIATMAISIFLSFNDAFEFEYIPSKYHGVMVAP